MTLPPILERALSRPALAGIAGFVRDGGTRGIVARGALSAVAINVTGTGIAFGVQVLLARALGQHEYGTYLYVLGWMNLAMLFTKVDLDIVATRYVGSYRVTSDWAHLRGLMRRGTQIVFITSLLTGLAAIGVIELLPKPLPRVVVLAAGVTALLLPVSALIQFASAALQGYRRVIDSQMPHLIVRPIVQSVILLALWIILRHQLPAYAALAANFAASLVALGLFVLLLSRAMPDEARAVQPAYATREWVKTGSWLLSIDLCQLAISQQTGILVAGTVTNTTAAGHYGAASQLAQLVAFGMTGVTFIAAPLISELYVQQRRDALQRMVSMCTLLGLGLAAPVLLGLVALGHRLLGLYGPEFQDAYTVLLLLGLTQLVSSAVGSLAGTIMSMTGEHVAAARFVAVSAVVTLGLAVPLTMRLGLAGTALANLVGAATRSVLLWVYLRRKLGILVVPSRLRG